jgi:hypothetical protein
VIGVLCPKADLPAAAELFELFKTPWAPFVPERSFDLVIAEGEAPETDASLVIVFAVLGARASGSTLLAGSLPVPIYEPLSTISTGAPLARTEHGEIVVAREIAGESTMIRCGYSLLGEVRRLLGEGQPLEHAPLPTLELHLDLLRRWILEAGVSFVEIPPRPAGSRFVASLTHDIDFLRLRDHRFDHTLAGFLFRATAGSVRDGLQRRRSWRDVGRNLAAAAATPVSQLGLWRDPWRPFESYLEADSPHRSTFFVVPFAGRQGQRVEVANARRRAVRYQLEHARPSIEQAAARGFEIAVHGIDAWVDSESARIERERIAAVAGGEPEGVRMHWLCSEAETPLRLEKAGFAYDATFGYNDAVGFKAGTLQPYRPLNCSHLLELPLHLQDTSLFYPRRMSLRPPEAWSLAESLVEHARTWGGVLSVSWHDRSLGPERLWGDFYAKLLTALGDSGATFLTAGEAVSLFRARRSIQLEPSPAGKTIRLVGDTKAVTARLLVRVNRPGGRATETAFRGDQVVELPPREPSGVRS